MTGGFSPSSQISHLKLNLHFGNLIVYEQLIQKGIRFTMCFLANLCMKYNDQDHTFKTQ